MLSFMPGGNAICTAMVKENKTKDVHPLIAPEK